RTDSDYKDYDTVPRPAGSRLATTASSQPRNELDTRTAEAFSKSWRLMMASVGSPRVSKSCLCPPGSRPQLDGGVSQRPASSCMYTLLRLASQTWPLWLQNTISKNAPFSDSQLCAASYQGLCVVLCRSQ